MRVFYVRPADNGNYCIPEALASLTQPPDQIDVALFRGLRVPLEPLNYDPAERGFARLADYDLVVLAGLDPVVLSYADHLAIVAFTERGGGLMLLGGSHSFGNAEGTYFPFAALLPVRIHRGLDVEVNALPRPAEHPIARGLPEPLGYIGKVHPIEAKPGAEQVLSVGDLPLAVAGEFGYGRVLVLASYPECHESEYGWFFTGDAFDDFVRNAVAWLAKHNPPVWIDCFTLPNREVTTGTDTFGKVLLKAHEPTDATLTTRLTRDGEVLHENTTKVHVAEAHEAIFTIRVRNDPAADGLHYVSAHLADAHGHALGYREVALEVVNPTRVSLELEHGRRCFFPGDTARLRVHAFSERRVPPQSVTVDVTLLDDADTALASLDRRTLSWAGNGYEDADFELPVPHLSPGAYRLVATLRFGQGLADVAEEPFHVLARPVADPSFPLIAGGAHHLDRASIDSAVAELASTGANTVSLPGPVCEPWGERHHAEAMLGYAQEQALLAGLALAHHHRSLVPDLTASTPLEPCPLTPPFRGQLESHARPILAAAARTPSLLSHEIAPHTAVRHEQLCRCEACCATYTRLFGGDMPTDPPDKLPATTHHNLCSLVSSYWWHVYSAIRALCDEAAPSVRLSLPFAADSFLREDRRSAYCDLFSWIRACDVVDVAPEPTEAAYRLSLSGHRALCAAFDKPFGALIDLAADALPPAEAAYTALAHGAAHLRVADNPPFVASRRQPPLAQAIGHLFPRIAKAGPLLALSQRPPARVALLFPFTQVVDAGSEGLLDAFTLLCAAVGEVDILHQRVARDERIHDYAAIAMLGTSQLPKKAARQLVEFVERGGLLIADRADLADEAGHPLPWPEGFFGEAQTPVFESVSRRRRAYGKGHTTLFSTGIATAYSRAADRDDVVAAKALSRAVADALAHRGVRPRVHATNPAVEVGLRTCTGATLLVAVNHSDERQTANLAIGPDVAPAACAYDLATGEEHRIEPGDNPSLHIDLRPHDGGVWVLYAERPFSLRLELTDERLAPGDTLRYKTQVINHAGQPIAASTIVRAIILDPDGAERPDLGGNMLTHDGVLEVDQPIAVNEQPGTWTLCVTDTPTRRIVRRTFDLLPPPDEADSPDNPTTPRNNDKHP